MAKHMQMRHLQEVPWPGIPGKKKRRDLEKVPAKGQNPRYWGKGPQKGKRSGKSRENGPLSQGKGRESSLEESAGRGQASEKWGL